MEDKIRKILNENSGGIKFLPLLTKLMEGDKEITSADEILAVINTMPEVKILIYTWHPLNREKMFIYTP